MYSKNEQFPYIYRKITSLRYVPFGSLADLLGKFSLSVFKQMEQT